MVLCSDREAYGNCIGTEFSLDFIHAGEEISSDSVHFVYIGNLWNTILVRLSPHGLGLGLYAADCAECRNRPVQYSQRAFDFDGEINMSRSVYQVDLIGVSMEMPECGGSSGGNSDTTLLLLHHPVHCGGSFMNFADLVGLTGVEKDTFGRSGLTGINVCHDTDIPGVFEIPVGHLTCGLETEVGKCLVGLCHPVHVLFTLERATFVVVSSNDFSSEFFCHRVS